MKDLLPLIMVRPKGFLVPYILMVDENHKWQPMWLEEVLGNPSDEELLSRPIEKARSDQTLTEWWNLPEKTIEIDGRKLLSRTARCLRRQGTVYRCATATGTLWTVVPK